MPVDFVSTGISVWTKTSAMTPVEESWQADRMPAPFMPMLAGYRVGGNPNTSDNNDDLSKELGHELFRIVGTPSLQLGPDDPGAALEQQVMRHLAVLRPDLQTARSASAVSFEQYEHLDVFPRYKRGHQGATRTLAPLIAASSALHTPAERVKLMRLLDAAAKAFQKQDDLAFELMDHMPQEALLKVDITIAEPQVERSPLLHVALSSKWSLRTDRAQDCVSQGAKLVAQRRGRMPHFGVVTMETRPSMLKILGDGSGAVDCVYHLNLPALEQAMLALSVRDPRRGEDWSPMKTFRRLVRQRRLRDYDDLVTEVKRLPVPLL